jgi:hypothetical protein
MWLAYAILYMLLIAFAAFMINARTTSTEVTAKRELPADHLIIAGDIETPRDVSDEAISAMVAPYVGRYSAKLIPEKRVLTLTELTAVPLLEKNKGTSRVLFPVKAEHVASGEINAKRPAHLCVPAFPPIKVIVVTVLCAPGVRDPCSAVVDLPPGIPSGTSGKLNQGGGEILPPSTAACS